MLTKKAIVVFYSHSNKTRKAAERLQAATGADIFELEPVCAYPPDYSTVVKQAKQEIARAFKPELKKIPDISQYDVIFAGSPNWWSTIAPPVATFLSARDFSGKLIAPFMTHGGGGLGTCAGDIKKLCRGAEVAAGFDANHPGKLESWLAALGVMS